MHSVELRHASGATARVYDHGAHLTSWRTADGVERIFLSDLAQFKPGLAIRGGVPLIFPQFAALGPLPKHGFARTTQWLPEAMPEGVADSAAWVLTDSPATQAIWPHRFKARYQVRLAAHTLNLQFSVINMDNKPCTFTAALHTYLRVADISRVTIQGLQGCRYRDSARGNVDALQTDQALTFAGEVDRIYFSASKPIVIDNAQVDRIYCTASGFADAVIWNPGATLAATLSDLSDGYQHMVCVEAAAIAQPIALVPGEQWTGSQTLTIAA